jgi:hypothetical protein
VIKIGLVAISSTLSVRPISQGLDTVAEPTTEAGQTLEKTFPRFADDLAWWTEAAAAQRARGPLLY